MTQAGVIWKRPLSDWPVGKSVGHIFINCYVGELSPLPLGGWSGVVDEIRLSKSWSAVAFLHG